MFDEIQIKVVPSFIVVGIENEGVLVDFNRDLDRVFGYLYENNLEGNIAGPGMGLFFSEFGSGKYIAAVPVANKIFSVIEDIRLISLPEIECAFLVHRGSYSTIQNSFDRLKQYFRRHRFQWGFPVRELYLKTSGPEEEFLTEIQVPVKR